MRTSLRRKHGIGEPDCNCCDCFLSWCICTGPCTLCQECRSVETERWDWIDQCARQRYFQRITEPHCKCCFSGSCNLCRPSGAENEEIKSNPYSDLEEDKLGGVEKSASIGRIVSLIIMIISLIGMIIFGILACIASPFSASVIFAVVAFVCWTLFLICFWAFYISTSCCLGFNRQVSYVDLAKGGGSSSGSTKEGGNAENV